VDEVFIPGLRLAGEFYAEVVRPLLGQEFPGLRYAAALLGPGSEVLGSAFSRVPGSAGLAASLAGAVSATDWPERERQLGQAYVTVAEAHNRLGLTRPLDASTRLYYSRPFRVLDAGRFAAALADAITDPVIGQLPPIGAADQFIDNTDALGDLHWARAVITAREGQPG
jgi:hypothetical protein